MATSNTKLDNYDKQVLGNLKRENHGVTIVNNGQTTIAFQLKGNTVQFATAVASPEEKKFRRKVGEYHALIRYADGVRVSLEKWDFCTMLENVFFLREAADTLAASFPD